MENFDIKQIKNIVAGENGLEIAENLQDNFLYMASYIIDLENKISALTKSLNSVNEVVKEQTTSSSLTGSVNIFCTPSIITGRTSSTEETVCNVEVRVVCGSTELKPGTDNGTSQYTYELTNTEITEGTNIVGSVEDIVKDGVLTFKVTIQKNATSDSSVNFKIRFNGIYYYQSIPISISNENINGTNGQGIFISYVFKRATSVPDTPTGGTYDSPIPTGWYDGIPDSTGEDDYVYTSHRKFTSDNKEPQEDNWSVPVLAYDNGNVEYLYSPWNGEGSPKSPAECGIGHGFNDTDPSDYKWHKDGDSSDIWMAKSTRNAGTWSDWSIFRIKGEAGATGNWQDFIFKEWSGETLDAPTKKNPSEFVDKIEYSETDVNSGWHDAPSGTGYWWQCIGLIDGSTGELAEDKWSDPVKINTGEVVARSVFMSTVFKRCETKPEKPGENDGDYYNPVPTDWHDGIPEMDKGRNPLWETHRKFTSDGVEQDEAWSDVIKMQDSADFDCCYASGDTLPKKPTTHGIQDDEVWHNEGTSADTWMATSYINSTTSGWSDWVITRIKGESGKDGDYMCYIFKEYTGETLDAPTMDDPDEFVDNNEIDKTTQWENYGWHDGPGIGNDWWQSVGLIDGTTGKLDASASNVGWSTPARMMGKSGRGVFVSRVFKRSNDNPAPPTVGDFSNPVPTSEGWSDGIPGIDSTYTPVWESHRKFTSDGVGQDSNWSTPVKMEDGADFDCCYTSGDTLPSAPTSHGVQNDGIWHNEGTSADTWMATSRYNMGQWTSWTITRIKGEQGVGVFTSTVFARLDEQPNTPSGGTFEIPIPQPVREGGTKKDVTWTDSIPSGSTILWMSTRKFTSDGSKPQENSWSTPVIASDTSDFDCCYSAWNREGSPESPDDCGLGHGVQNNEIWHNEGTSDDIWMATSYKSATSGWSAWTVTKIKGEDGSDGNWEMTIYKEHTGDTLAAPTANTVSEFVDKDDIDSPNNDWKRNLSTNGNWWKSTGLIKGSDNDTVVSGWTTPVKALPKDGSYTEVQYAVNQSETSAPNTEDAWFDTIEGLYKYQDENNSSGTWKSGGNYCLSSGWYLWERDRRWEYDKSTGSLTARSWEYIRKTGEKGEAGNPVYVQGTCENFEELFTEKEGKDGNAYIVSGYLYVWYDSVTPEYYKDKTDEEKEKYVAKYGTTSDKLRWTEAGKFQGDAGTSSYVHIKYASVLDLPKDNPTYPSKEEVTDSPSNYIGIYVDSNKEAPKTYSLYTWSSFKGEDGFGYEYIYRLNDTSTPYDLNNPSDIDVNATVDEKTKEDDDFVPRGWTDNPSGVSSTSPYEFMFVRQKKNGVWGDFKGTDRDNNKAILYNYYGKDAPYIERQWAIFEALVFNTSMANDKVWSKTIPNASPTNGKYLWERTRTITPAYGSNGEIKTDWQYFRVSGERGDAGTGVTIKSTFSSYHALFSLSDNIKDGEHACSGLTNGKYTLPDDGDCYVVNEDLWIWAGSDDYSTTGTSKDEKTTGYTDYDGDFITLDKYKEKYGTELYIGKWNNTGRFKGESGDTAYIHIKYASQATEVTDRQIIKNGGDKYIVSGISYQVTELDNLTNNNGEDPGPFMCIWTDNSSNEVVTSGMLETMVFTKNKGDDGVNYEYIYTRTATEDAPSWPYNKLNELLSGQTFYKVTTSVNSDGSPDETKDITYQEADFIPNTTTYYNENKPAYRLWNNNWTDNPMGVDSTWKYEWCMKRTKDNGQWRAFVGRADSLKTPFLYSKYGDDAMMVDINPNAYVYHTDNNGNISSTGTSIDVNAKKNNLTQAITSVSAGTKVLSTSKYIDMNGTLSGKWDSTNTKILIQNPKTLTEDGSIQFAFLISGETYVKNFNYSVVKDGKKGADAEAITTSFSPEVITASQSLNTGLVDSATTYTYFNLYLNGDKIKTDDYKLEADTTTKWNDLIEYSITSEDDYTYKFHISNFNKNGNFPQNGTARFTVSYQPDDDILGEYSVSCGWSVNWIKQWTIHAQSAITLSVGEALSGTGIDITNHKIELNANNTVVNGELDIRNINDGKAIVLYDNENNDVVYLTNNDIEITDPFNESSLTKCSNHIKFSKTYSGDNTITFTGCKIADSITKNTSILTKSHCFYFFDKNGDLQTFDNASISIGIIGKLNNSNVTIVENKDVGTLKISQDYSLYSDNSFSYTFTSAYTDVYLQYEAKLSGMSNICSAQTVTYVNLSRGQICKIAANGLFIRSTHNKSLTMDNQALKISYGDYYLNVDSSDITTNSTSIRHMETVVVSGVQDVYVTPKYQQYLFSPSDYNQLNFYLLPYFSSSYNQRNNYGWLIKNGYTITVGVLNEGEKDFKLNMYKDIVYSKIGNEEYPSKSTLLCTLAKGQFGQFMYYNGTWYLCSLCSQPTT